MLIIKTINYRKTSKDLENWKGEQTIALVCSTM
jgi:hypothetical protein